MTRKKRFLCGFLSGCLMLFSAVGVFAAEPEPQEAALAAPELFVLSYAPHDPAQNEEGGKDITVSYLLSEETLLQLSEQKELRVQLDFAANENSFHTDEASYLTFDDGIQPLTQFSFGDIQTETTRSQLGEAYFSYKTQRSGSSRVTVWYLNEDVTLYARMRIVVAEQTGEWSQAVCFGAQTTELPAFPSSFSAPSISDAKLSIEDQSISFFLSVPPQIRTYAALLLIREDGEAGAIAPHFEYSVNSAEFAEAELPENTGLLVSEKVTVPLPQGTLQDYSFAQLRNNYTVTLPDGTSQPTAPSQTILANSQAHEDVTTAPQEQVESATEAEVTVASKYGACPICGHCSQPLGICIFIWLGAVLVIAVIAMIAILIRFLAQKKSCPRCGKGCRKNARVCEKCGFRFTANLPLIEEGDRKRGKRKKGEEKDPLDDMTEENTLQGVGGVSIPYSADTDAPQKEKSAADTETEKEQTGGGDTK